METFKKFYIVTKKTETFLFLAFLATYFLSIRKILFFYPLIGAFNEYTGIYLYISDVFILGTMFLLLCNNIIYLSINYSLLTSIVPRETLLSIIKKQLIEIKSQVIHSPICLSLLAFTALSFASIFWSKYPFFALYKAIKLFELLFIFFYFSKKVSRGTILKTFLWITIAIASINSVLAIAQFILQHSIGFSSIIESYISPEIPGVAKLVFNNYKYIRSYGLFPHPNIFGGFLLFSIISTYSYLKLFHVEQLSAAKNTNILYSIKRHVPRGTIIHSLIGIQLIALFLSFSKSAIIGLIIASVSIYLSIVPRGTIIRTIRKCSTWNNMKPFLIVGVILLLILNIIKPDSYVLTIKSLLDREFYLTVSRGTFLENPFFGVGLGQFVANMADNYSLEKWQLQPVHNVFLLILNETGIFSLLLFINSLIYIIKSDSTVKQAIYKNIIVPRGTNAIKHSIIFENYKGALFGLIFIMLFDHYVWDIQQGIIIFWLSLALMYGSKFKKKEIKGINIQGKP